MTETVKPVINLADVPLRDNAHGEAFAAKIGPFGSMIGSKMGVMLHVVEPGKKAFPFHVHHMTQELFVILEGEGTYRFGSESYPVKAGDVCAAPAGGPEVAHQIINTGNDDAEISRHLGQSGRRRRGRVSGFEEVRGLLALRLGDRQGRRALCRPRRELARLLGRRMMAVWFKPHRYGFGATPVSWQGWMLVGAEGKGGIYNFVTKRGDCRGDRSKISWTQVETGSAITWKYPSCILRGDDHRASSIRSPCRTATSRSTAAPR